MSYGSVKPCISQVCEGGVVAFSRLQPSFCHRLSYPWGKYFDKRNQLRNHITGRNVQDGRGYKWESGRDPTKERRWLDPGDGHAERCGISDPAIHCPVHRNDGFESTPVLTSVISGRGVFAGKDIPSRTVLEVSPVLVLDPAENEEYIKKTDLYNYT
jgi:hypothetical protein